MPQPRHPALYEINTRIWIEALSKTLERVCTFDDVADSTLEEWSALGFEWIWLLGVWQTGEAGRQVSLQFRNDYRPNLPDMTDADLCSSPFAVQDYRVHRDFGGNAALQRLRERLRSRGLRLMLDFVPNHTAPDHDWVRTHPEYYIAGTEAEWAQSPQNYTRIHTDRGPMILAHGRDPNFPGWPDTLQLNYRHAGLRNVMLTTLEQIAGLCDGLRCDMAMLLLPDVIERTWDNSTHPIDGSKPVDEGFWPEAIRRVRALHPHFVLLAEAYWDLEWTLQQQGFDFTYDKRLYDRLRVGNAAEVRAHLHATLDYQTHSARFLENHDEDRAAAVFSPGMHQAAAVVTYLAPGLRLFHDGQLEGRKVRASVHLARRAQEPRDDSLRDFYAKLLACLKRPEPHEKCWRLCDCKEAWSGNGTWNHFIAFTWETADRERLLVVVNYGPTEAQCYVALPWPDLCRQRIVFQDLMSTAAYSRNGDDIHTRGLYLDLPAWGFHVFSIR